MRIYILTDRQDRTDREANGYDRTAGHTQTKMCITLEDAWTDINGHLRTSASRIKSSTAEATAQLSKLSILTATVDP